MIKGTTRGDDTPDLCVESAELYYCVHVCVYDAECVCVSERYEPWAVAAGQTFAQSATAAVNTLKFIDAVFGGSRSEQEG